MKKTIIFDIDGTLADSAHRYKKYIKDKDWDKMIKESLNDRAVPEVKRAYDLYLADNTPLVLMTGRYESQRELTIKWLEKRGITGWKILLMRPDGDNREDWIVKHELYLKLKDEGVDVEVVYEDRDQVVAMWRANKVPCFQVRKGDY